MGEICARPSLKPLNLSQVMPAVNSLSAYCQALHQGSIVALPTDTVWGLACLPAYADRLYALKRRSPDKSLILMGADAADLWPYSQGNTADMASWQQLAQQHWPGQLTLILPSSPRVPLVMHPRTPTTLGMRVPDHPLARRILRDTGPLATTSANLSGQPPLEDLGQMLAQFPEVVGLDAAVAADLAPPAAPASGQPSTVVRWQPPGWEVIRQGAIRLP